MSTVTLMAYSLTDSHVKGVMMQIWREVAIKTKEQFRRGMLQPLGYNFADFAGDADCFYGVWGYDRWYDDPANTTGRVIDHIVLDLDTQDLQVVRTVINRIQRENCDFLLYFSGTGFHVVIPNVWDFTYKDVLNTTLKHTVLRNFPEADPSCYDKSRVIRMPGTVNSKTGAYKSWLSIHMLNFEYEQILGSCMVPDTGSYPEELPENMGTAFGAWPIVYSAQKPIIVTRVDKVRSPKCVHSFLQASPNQGQRHLTALRIASHLIHYVGLVPEQAHANLCKWLENEPDWNDAMSREMLTLCENVAYKPYRYGCSDTFLRSHCSADCAYYRGKDYMGRFVTITDSFLDYKRRIDNGEYWDLADVIPIGHSVTVFNDDLFGIIGTQGVGKSALAMHIVLALSHKRHNLLTWYINMDTSDGAMSRRAIQWEARLKKEQIFTKSIPTDDANKIKAAMQYLDNHVVFSNHREINEIDSILRNPQAHRLPRKPDIVVVDHVGNLSSNDEGGYERMKFLGEQLKELPKRHNTLFIALGHVRKADYYNNDLTVASASDANLGQAADVLIGIHARGTEVIDGNVKEREDNDVEIISLKLRDNPDFRIKMLYDYEYFTFEPWKGPKLNG